MTGVAMERVAGRAGRVAEEHTFLTHDGTRLMFRHWPAVASTGANSAGGRAQGAVILLHRGHEHSGRVAHLVDELNLPEHAFFAWDMRAHGRSGGQQDSRTTMSTFVQDLDDFVRAIRNEFGYEEREIAVVAQSIGAVIASAWAHDYAPRIRCLVLASPAFAVKLYVPFARLGLAAGHAAMGDFFVQSYVQGSALTRDKERAASYGSDPLVKRPISVRVLLSLYGMASRVVEDAAAIRVPVQMLISGSDWVVRRGPQREFFERLGTGDKEWHLFDGFLHDTLGERERHLPVAKAREFLLRTFAAAPSLANGNPLTQAEYEAMGRPLPWWSPKAWPFAGQRWFMRTLGRWSAGMRLGTETGFDSGASLDYVYRNEAQGFTPLGRLFDWFYLNAIGWRGIRVRKQLLEELLGSAMRAVTRQGRGVRMLDVAAGQGRGVRMLDVAAGQGRYVIDGIARAGIRPESVLLRDFVPANVEAGRVAIARAGLAQARFEQGDAFDAASYAAGSVNVAIVSGLYELFPDNAVVAESLRGIAAAVEPGGSLVYTGQPWHPQLEMIARTLSSHRNGAAWVMRRRTQEELDELVECAGFRKVEQRVDPTGLFTVSRAERL